MKDNNEVVLPETGKLDFDGWNIYLREMYMLNRDEYEVVGEAAPYTFTEYCNNYFIFLVSNYLQINENKDVH